MAMKSIPIGTALAVAVTGLILTVTVLVSGLLTASQRVPATGNVKTVGVGVYWNYACTSNVTSIDWSSLAPGATANRTVYIKNTGSNRIMINMTTSNWSTGTSGKMNLVWNCEGQLLDAASVVQGILTLSISSTISGVTNFSFDITINGIEHA
jgi:hypothetical protein